MSFRIIRFNLQREIKDFAFTIIFCIFIALFLYLMDYADSFPAALIMSFSIGIVIFLLINISIHLCKPKRKIVLVSLITLGIILGGILGWNMGTMIVNRFLHVSISVFDKYLIRAVMIWMVFGSGMTFFFWARARLSITKDIIQEERNRRISSEKDALEARLRLLQAQIEPHFLFNTLSNILSLLDTDPRKGKTMLMDLMKFLRTSLSKTRSNRSNIGQEIELIRAYLDIFKVRMGERLRYSIDIPEGMEEVSFPPMLIQPLVENAIKHGLESKIGGGELLIRGSLDNDKIRIEVIDTGPGFFENSNPGMGIENLRKRLQSIYGDKAGLILEENRPTGLKAIIEVPYEQD